MTATANQQRQQKPETIDEVVSFALAHQTRVQILTVLAEGVHSTEEIAQKIGEPNKRVSHHIKELVERGSIELVEKRPVRNAIQHFYRAIEMPEYSDEEIAAMTPHQRRITAGLVIQSIVAEALAALGAGHLSEDPEVILVSRWFHLDRQGRREVGEVLRDAWERCYEIEAEAVNRVATSGEATVSMMVELMNYERSRRGPRHQGPTLPAIPE